MVDELPPPVASTPRPSPASHSECGLKSSAAFSTSHSPRYAPSAAKRTIADSAALATSTEPSASANIPRKSGSVPERSANTAPLPALPDGLHG